MPRQCGWCAHPDREELERRVNNGESIRQVAGETGYSESAAQRHVRNHMGRALLDEIRVSAQLHIADFADRLIHLIDESAAVRDHARRVSDPRLLLQATREERETLGFLMNRLGIDDDATVACLHEAQALVNAVIRYVSDGHPDVARKLAKYIEIDGEHELSDSLLELAAKSEGAGGVPTAPGALPHPHSANGTKERCR